MEKIPQFILNHWQLCCLLIVLFIALIINEWLSQKKRAKELSPQSAVALMNSGAALTIIDLRDKESYRKGHIIEAMSAKADDFNGKGMDKYKDTQLLLVCARGI